MTISLDSLKYEWEADWAKLPAMEGWSHHGLVINRDGNIVTGHATEPKILVLDKDGELLKEFKVPVTETHGICIVEEDGVELLWIADTGDKHNSESYGPPRVVKVDMEGNELAQITKENLGYGKEEWFCPTSVAVDSRNGDIWIADGYGESRVHRLSKDFEHMFGRSGTKKVGGFSCPHWIFIDPRKEETQVYVADRANHRVQVLNRNGRLVSSITEGLKTPSVFSSFGDYLVIGELYARLVVLDKEDNIVGYIGDGTEYTDIEGWPNRKDGKKLLSPLSDISVGKFNSPHGMAADCEGNIYISEWLLGDRFTKLKRIA